MELGGGLKRGQLQAAGGRQCGGLSHGERRRRIRGGEGGKHLVSTHLVSAHWLREMQKSWVVVELRIREQIIEELGCCRTENKGTVKRGVALL